MYTRSVRCFTFMSHGDVPGSTLEVINEPEYRKLDRIIRGCMKAEKEERYQSAEELQRTLQELQNQIKRAGNRISNRCFTGAGRGSERPMQLSECLTF